MPGSRRRSSGCRSWRFPSRLTRGTWAKPQPKPMPKPQPQRKARRRPPPRVRISVPSGRRQTRARAARLRHDRRSTHRGGPRRAHRGRPPPNRSYRSSSLQTALVHDGHQNDLAPRNRIRRGRCSRRRTIASAPSRLSSTSLAWRRRLSAEWCHRPPSKTPSQAAASCDANTPEEIRASQSRQCSTPSREGTTMTQPSRPTQAPVATSPRPAYPSVRARRKQHGGCPLLAGHSRGSSSHRKRPHKPPAAVSRTTKTPRTQALCPRYTTPSSSRCASWTGPCLKHLTRRRLQRGNRGPRCAQILARGAREPASGWANEARHQSARSLFRPVRYNIPYHLILGTQAHNHKMRNSH
mmetsp:Transcript_24828/g.74697  ORF Transcript_24828/g.74697 Transcript_24828/m.74697 type:complete len:353 (+) Transcript_24828:1571-2629(+)